MKIPYVNNHDISIYYETKGHGKPIFFIHPPAMGHITFKKQFPLANEFQLITFDIRGHGKSGYKKNEKVTISKVADDMLAIINELKLNRVVLCGYSNGGSFALEFAIKYPERVEGMILSGGFSEVNSFLLRREFKLGEFISKVNGTPLLGKILAKSHTKNQTFQSEIFNYVKQTNSQILEQLYYEGLQYNCSHKLNEIQVPILLIYGKRDFYLHHYQSIFLNEHPNTEVVYISNIGHQIPTKRFNEFNRLVKNFMTSLDNREECFANG